MINRSLWPLHHQGHLGSTITNSDMIDIHYPFFYLFFSLITLLIISTTLAVLLHHKHMLLMIPIQQLHLINLIPRLRPRQIINRLLSTHYIRPGHAPTVLNSLRPGIFLGLFGHLRVAHEGRAFDAFKVDLFDLFCELLTAKNITSILLCISFFLDHSSLPMLGPRPPNLIHYFLWNCSLLDF